MLVTPYEVVLHCMLTFNVDFACRLLMLTLPARSPCRRCIHASHVDFACPPGVMLAPAPHSWLYECSLGTMSTWSSCLVWVTYINFQPSQSQSWKAARAKHTLYMMSGNKAWRAPALLPHVVNYAAQFEKAFGIARESACFYPTGLLTQSCYPSCSRKQGSPKSGYLYLHRKKDINQAFHHLCEAHHQQDLFGMCQAIKDLLGITSCTYHQMTAAPRPATLDHGAAAKCLVALCFFTLDDVVKSHDRALGTSSTSLLLHPSPSNSGNIDCGIETPLSRGTQTHFNSEEFSSKKRRQSHSSDDVVRSKRRSRTTHLPASPVLGGLISANFNGEGTKRRAVSKSGVVSCSSSTMSLDRTTTANTSLTLSAAETGFAVDLTLDSDDDDSSIDHDTLSTTATSVSNFVTSTTDSTLSSTATDSSTRDNSIDGNFEAAAQAPGTESCQASAAIFESNDEIMPLSASPGLVKNSDTVTHSPQSYNSSSQEFKFDDWTDADFQYFEDPANWSNIDWLPGAESTRPLPSQPPTDGMAQDIEGRSKSADVSEHAATHDGSSDNNPDLANSFPDLGDWTDADWSRFVHTDSQSNDPAQGMDAAAVVSQPMSEGMAQDVGGSCRATDVSAHPATRVSDSEDNQDVGSLFPNLDDWTEADWSRVMNTND